MPDSEALARVRKLEQDTAEAIDKLIARIEMLETGAKRFPTASDVDSRLDGFSLGVLKSLTALSRRIDALESNTID